MQNEIWAFVRSNNVASICCSDRISTRSFCCFYAFGSDDPCLIFKSNPDSKHSNIFSHNPQVSGTIISSGATILDNVGIQLEGVVIEQIYYLRYPFAIVVSGKLYSIQIDKIKYTATTHGKRVKLEWAREKINSY